MKKFEMFTFEKETKTCQIYDPFIGPDSGSENECDGKSYIRSENSQGLDLIFKLFSFA